MESLPVSYFDTVCEFVSQTYSDLLSPREQQWLSSVNSLDSSAKILYVRLLNRSFNSFRVSKLNYEDVTGIPSALNALAQTSLANTAPPQKPSDLNRLFTKPEFIALFARPDLKNKVKAELVDAIYRDQSNALALLHNSDQWVTIEGHDVYSWFLLCFFGNRYQDTTEFVLRELGHTRYYPYALDKINRAFDSREQIDAHLIYYECASKYEYINKRDRDALLQLDNSLPVYQQGDPTLTRRVERLRVRLARQLERIDCRHDALKLYAQCDRAPARERMVRIHQHNANFDASWQLLQTIEQHPYCDEELQFVDMIKPKLARLMGNKLPAKRFKPISSKLVLTQHSTARVEQIAQAYYQHHGDCYYAENSLFNGVLGLLIWDEIFAPLPGAFFNPFQYAPADFYDPAFCQRRQQSIAASLDELDKPGFEQQILSRFDDHFGIANPLVRWDYLSQSLLKLALQTIPKHHWRACFERQLQDLRHNTSGFPDLVHFPKTGGYELIEIKGPGDAVQKNQNRWFAYFESVGVPYRVVHIKWAGTVVAG
ncbi:MAG: VRR-NUC domain-containing protein [Granulosicoccaceae bacterium]